MLCEYQYEIISRLFLPSSFSLTNLPFLHACGQRKLNFLDTVDNLKKKKDKKKYSDKSPEMSADNRNFRLEDYQLKRKENLLDLYLTLWDTQLKFFDFFSGIFTLAALQIDQRPSCYGATWGLHSTSV